MVGELRGRLSDKNVTLRKLRISDADSIARHIHDKTVARWTINVPYPYQKKNALKFIRERQNERKTRKSYTFGISLNPDDEIIGGIDLFDVDWDDKKAEMGYWIGKIYRRQGLMTEAINLMLEFAFNDLKLHKIYARVFDGNVPSMKALKRNGFKLEGHLRGEIFKNRRWIDELYFGLLKSEYRKLKLN